MIRLVFLRDFGVANLVLTMVWFATVVSGLIILLNYETRPGLNRGQMPQWPAGSAIDRSTDRPTVVMFAHPHCPCTRASVREFEKVHAICHSFADFRVVAYEPIDAEDDWRNSPIVSSLSAIPGVSVFWDGAGTETGRFNVSTSGHVLLYGSSGQLRFTGGITGSRGHEGSNIGSSRLISSLKSHLERGTTDLLDAPVFGCPIFDDLETIDHE